MSTYEVDEVGGILLVPSKEKTLASVRRPGDIVVSSLSRLF